METKLGWNGFCDGMLEHAFERLPIMITNKLNLKIKIVSKNYSKNILHIEKIVNSEIISKENYINY